MVKVSVVHGYYSSRQPSGENVVVDLQVDALRRSGHEVNVVALRQDEVEQKREYVVGAAWRAATGRGPSPLREIENFRPDVVHVHNLFPNFGRHWVRALSRPVVATMHNFRPLCPAATLFRDGGSCTRCLDTHSALPAIRWGCYKGSRLATVPVAIGTRFEQDPLLAHAAGVIALSDPMRQVYVRAGVTPERLVTIPNFVPAPSRPGAHGSDYWLYVGRLTEEKGIVPLVRAWPRDKRLLVVGAGPLEEQIRQIATSNVELLGMQSGERVKELLADTRGLVFPSQWPEGLPTVYLEALSLGTPVLATAESIVGALVAEEGSGVVLEPGYLDCSRPDLAKPIARLEAIREEVIARSKAAYDSRYCEAVWIERIIELYESVIAE